MGIYLNPDSSKFEEAVNSDIYIDKTGLLTYTNSGFAYDAKIHLY